MALALFKIDAPIRHFVSCQCKDSGVPLLGPILGVNFRSSGAQKRGPSYLKPHSSDSVLGGQKMDPIFKMSGAHFRTKKRDPKRCREFRILLVHFRGEFNKNCFLARKCPESRACLCGVAALLVPWLSRRCRLLLERAFIVKSNLLLFRAPFFTPQN